MTLRRRRGATLGFVAICVLVVIVCGLAAFFLAKLMGGAREVAHATDAGVLNMAKQSMSQISVPAPDEFKGCADATTGEINLLNYNRCVAQTLIVAMNAQKEGTEAAKANAQHVADALYDLCDALGKRLRDPQVQGDFCEQVANSNNTRMFGSTPVLVSGFETAFMKAGESTNVYFAQGLLPGAAPADLFSSGKLKGPNGEPYMAGYVTFASLGLEKPISGVPVFPQQKPHLVSLLDFSTSTAKPQDMALPNAFRADTGARDQKTKAMGGAVACAIVGTLEHSFEAAIPMGYIEFSNLPGKSLPATWGSVVLASDSIFNHQIYYGIDVAALGDGTYAFSRRPGELAAWAAYNNSGKDAGLYPPTLTSPPETRLAPPGYPLNFTMRAGCSKGQWATALDAAKVTSVTHCTAYSYGETKDQLCVDALGCMKQVYGDLVADEGQAEPYAFTNVEYVKADVINALQTTADGSANITPPAEASGLKYFEHDKTYLSPPLPCNFAQDGTIMQLIEQASTCKAPSIFEQIVQRCREIKPGVSDAAVRNLLSSTVIPMGKNSQPNVLYLYKSGNDLVINGSKPPGYTTTKPDGPDPGKEDCMKVTYDTMWKQVNSKKTADSPFGDTGVWDAPFLEVPAASVMATDRAKWQPSSGRGNLLGKLEFSNETTGGGEFSAPN